MKQNIKNKNLIVLKVFSVIVMVLVTLFMFVIFLYTNPKLESHHIVKPENGIIDLSFCDIAREAPVLLNGEWEYFPGAFVERTNFTKENLKNPQKISLPIGSISASTGTATYKINFKLNPANFNSKPVIYIPILKNSINVFVNGKLVTPVYAKSDWIDYTLFRSIFEINSLDPQKEIQELIVSVNSNPNDTALYKRPIMISTYSGVVTTSFLNLTNEMLILGILILILINSYVFMFFLPKHKIMSLISLFDSMLIIRVIFELNETYGFLQSIFPDFVISDKASVSVQLIFIYLAGIIGCHLTKSLFDPEGKIPKAITNGIIVAYVIFIIILPFNYELFDIIGIPLMIVGYGINFAVFFFEFAVCLRKNKNFYYLFQILKTIYVSVIIFFDILSFNSKINYLPFIYLYMIFFMLHVIIRLYDSNKSYLKVDILVQSLEDTVQKRTEELSKANKVLAEISIRDPLTNAFNRLYFEQIMEKTTKNFEDGIDKVHLCMFDLDFFKSINDKYGHDVGDDQLIKIVKIVQENMCEGCVLSRIGGEEFAIIYQGATSKEASENVEKIRAIIEKDARENPKHTTASFGLVKFSTGIKHKDFYKMADVCLYNAKNGGRNKVVCNFCGALSQK